ncbi:hypothetical protein L1987_09891 [Smallanthus sonchifolius]|uniref:Uncharacterized protein n=1 Tax=Smallanthus sonchifolius TaxID=185202 RepID=A0ACB9JQR2_9ASTR|nr:hypothetical protein L1987_09891 [Smallanthus sonchifolius]
MTSTETWQQDSALDRGFQILIQSFGSDDLQLEVVFSIRQKAVPDRNLQISGFLTTGRFSSSDAVASFVIWSLRK